MNVALLQALQAQQAMRDQEEAQAQAQVEQGAGMNMSRLAQLRSQPLAQPMAPPPTNSAQTAQSAQPMALSFMGGGMMGGMGGGMAGGAAGNMLGGSGGAVSTVASNPNNYSTFLDNAGSWGSNIADLARYGMARNRWNNEIQADNQRWLGGY